MNNCLSANFNLDRHINHHEKQMRLNKSDVWRQIQLPLCHFSNKINHRHPCLMACVMMDLPSFPTKSIICCPPPTGPKRTGSSGLVWRPTKHLSQGRLRESSGFAGHRHVERQHLGLQRWTGGPAADCSDVECTLRMLAWTRLTPPQTFTSAQSPLLLSQHILPFEQSRASLCSVFWDAYLHFRFIVTFIAVFFECRWMSQAFLCANW